MMLLFLTFRQEKINKFNSFIKKRLLAKKTDVSADVILMNYSRRNWFKFKLFLHILF